MSGSLPRLIEMQEKYAKHRERFAILAFHDATQKTFDELDPKLGALSKRYWKGKSLPFPILLDATGATIERFSIRAYPTSVLIDPKGKVVEIGAASYTLERVLKEGLMEYPPPEKR